VEHDTNTPECVEAFHRVGSEQCRNIPDTVENIFHPGRIVHSLRQSSTALRGSNQVLQDSSSIPASWITLPTIVDGRTNGWISSASFTGGPAFAAI